MKAPKVGDTVTWEEEQIVWNHHDYTGTPISHQLMGTVTEVLKDNHYRVDQVKTRILGSGMMYFVPRDKIRKVEK